MDGGNYTQWTKLLHDEGNAYINSKLSIFKDMTSTRNHFHIARLGLLEDKVDGMRRVSIRSKAA